MSEPFRLEIDRIKEEMAAEAAMAPDDPVILKQMLARAWTNRHYQQEELGRKSAHLVHLSERNKELEVAIRVILGVRAEEAPRDNSTPAA